MLPWDAEKFNCEMCQIFTRNRQRKADGLVGTSQHRQLGIGELLNQPIDDFNGINLVEIISEDGGDDDLIVSKITL